MAKLEVISIPVSLKWGLAAIAGAWLAWRIVTLGMANHAVWVDKDPDKALGWHARHPQANLDAGMRDLENKPDVALNRLRVAITENPAESRSYSALGKLLEKGGMNKLAGRAMETASEMGPQRSDVQLDVTLYQLRRGDFAGALPHWNTVLRHQPAMRSKLYPYLLSSAEDPASEPAFEKLLQEQVPWWSDFFVHAARSAASTDTARRLFSLSSKSVNRLPQDALQSYIQRLQKDGAWTESWFVWLNSLSKEEIAQSGYVYNGSFEARLSNTGFGWIYQKNPAVVMETATTYGTTGERALHLIFKGLRIKFENLTQYLLLPSGTYYLQGRARPDNLKANEGMQWAVYCLGQNMPLTVSDRFSGMDQWTRFRGQFTVPAGCPVQVLRLELAGRIALDYDVSGGIWFDDIAIEQASSLIRE